MLKPSRTQVAPKTKLYQNRTPFLDSLLVEKARWQTSFHMPGHKGTLPPNSKLLDYWGGDLHPADLVEINGIIDYLHSPKGALKEAQELAAQAYGADHTFFLINGSTVGNMASLMATCYENEKVIMPRASHRSVYGGVVMSGAIPVYVEPDYLPEVGFPLATSAETIARLLEENPGVRAVHITSPNYYGYMSDVRTIANLVHEAGAVLCVDEAHGSHLAFHEKLPSSAVELGADMVIQSTHKTQSALTQGSMLHVNAGRVNVARVGQILSLLQTSSPSSIILASIDAARHFTATQGRALLERAYNLAVDARATICTMDGLWCYGDDLVGKKGIYTYDPTKLVVRVSETGWSGFEFYDILRNDYGIDGEFADLNHVIFSVTMADNEESIGLLLGALEDISQRSSGKAALINEVPLPTGLPEMVMPPWNAYANPNSQAVPFAEALGQVSAENLIPYPPGIPLVVPGERIEQVHLDYLTFIRSQGGGVVGPEDTTLEHIRVVSC
jgi:arginine/lysine/ornithine decarboxylase